MPSSAPEVQPIQFVTEPMLIFARTTRVIALIMDATFPILRVCLIIVYGTSLLAWSIKVNRFWPLGEMMRVKCMKEARLSTGVSQPHLIGCYRYVESGLT